MCVIEFDMLICSYEDTMCYFLTDHYYVQIVVNRTKLRSLAVCDFCEKMYHQLINGTNFSCANF